MSEASFALTSDLDFYPFLKRNLPEGYDIFAEPQTGYYSEWLYCYKLYCGDELRTTYEGSYRDLPEGSLVEAAKQLLNELNVTHAHW